MAGKKHWVPVAVGCKAGRHKRVPEFTDCRYECSVTVFRIELSLGRTSGRPDLEDGVGAHCRLGSDWLRIRRKK